jgi:Brp/Blh family beta-carotene 15,15'-monooxygenase
VAVTGLPAEARERLSQWVVRPSWAALALSALPFLAGVDVPPWLLYAPFAASVLLFGLPHGAVDHVALARSGVPRPWVVVSLAYLVGGGGYLLGWLVAPAAAAVGFVLLTWFHWGQGDLAVLCSGETHLRSRLARGLTLVVRGGLPMVVPLLAFPETYREVVRAMATPFVAPPPSFDWLVAPGFRLALGGGLAAATLAALALGRHGAATPGTRRSWRLDAFESTLLWAYFLVVPPVLAVGIYFCLWHSTRHVARVETLDAAGRRALVDGELGTLLTRFARAALPNTVGALVVGVGLALAVGPGGTPIELLGRYLVLIAALTLPHTAVVTWLDLRGGVWRPTA